MRAPVAELKSPISGKRMEEVTLESGLRAYHCQRSGGYYITSADYMQWLQQQPARLPHLPKEGEPTAANPDPSPALICPETGTLMTRAKVGHGFGFSIDRSITGGVWLEKGEWEALKERNFHDEIHLIFTAPWQKHIRDERARKAYENTLETALGNLLLDRLTAVRDELAEHPHRNLAIAYLTEIATSPGSSR